MDVTTGLVLIGLGAVVWLFGNRMWLLGAGAGALLAFALMQQFPDVFGGSLGVMLVVGLAILLGAISFFGKAFVSLIAMGVGFVIGGGLALSVLGMLGLTFGALDWIVALIVAVIVAGLFSRFLDWALIIFASAVGSMLIVRGGMFAFPDLLESAIGSGIVVVLTIIGIYYHYRREQPR